MAKYFGGAAPIPWLQGLGRRALMRQYAVYERQSVEAEITADYVSPKKGEPKPLPSPRRMRALVDARITEIRAQEREEEEAGE